MKISTVIIEDEINARKALSNMLSFYCQEVEVKGMASSVTDGLKLLHDEQPDLLLLDIHLMDGTGFDLLKKLKKKDFKFVFTTAYDQYALKALKLSALDYLLKPIQPKELRIAIDKVKQALENDEQLNLQIDTCIHNFSQMNQDKKIILNTNDNVYVVEIKKLVHCEADENYCNIYVTGKDRIVISKPLKEVEEMLGGFGFYRVHQSHLINMSYIESVDKKGSGYVILSTGDRIPISQRKKQTFLQILKTLT
ncbi:MAG: response regulator transcription factor [Bacteroidales bacterium]|nr:response regulator transcription factor [Bacteroidales bacterium]